MPQQGFGGSQRSQAGYSMPSQGGDYPFTGQTFASLSLGESQGYQQPQGYSQGFSQGFSQQGDSQQGGYNLSLSQDFALTSSQEELYRFGEVWGAGPA